MAKEQELNLQGGGQQQAAQPQAPAVVTSQATEQAVIQIKNGLPEQLRPLQQCFIKPLETAKKMGIPNERYVQECNFAMQAMLKNTYLIGCAKNHPDEFVSALNNVLLTGMTLNPTLNVAYLVPYKGVVQMQTSYMGKKSYAINTGLCKDIDCSLVFKGEEFAISKGTNPSIKHIPNPWASHIADTLLGGYYVITYSSGKIAFDTMSKEDIEAIKKRSPSVGSGKQSPWDTDYFEMCKKTLINRAYKQLPKIGMSPEAQRALEIINGLDEQVAKDNNYGQNEQDDVFVDVTEV